VGVGKVGWILSCKFGTVSCEDFKLHHVRPQKSGKKIFHQKYKEFRIHTLRLLDQQKFFVLLESKYWEILCSGATIVQ
jgi:hypothetical protein